MRGNLKELLRLEFTDWTNLCQCEGKYDLPNISLHMDDFFIDHLILYSERNHFEEWDDCAMCFYEYDKVYDGYNGIYELIINPRKKKELEKFEKEVDKCATFISPDYSICGDIPFAENLHRIFKSRVVGSYLINKMGKYVIPNISFVDERTKEAAFMGVDKHSVVAISLMGCMLEKDQKKLIERILKETIKELEPSFIVLFNIASKGEFLDHLINIIKKSGTKYMLPDNKMWVRNRELEEKRKLKK